MTRKEVNFGIEELKRIIVVGMKRRLFLENGVCI